MPLPIVIADDSLLARKVLTKALPPDWDVDVSYASNGREALALYREGKASVMFLDLTMPDMTGYQVLEALQHEDLNTFVIVVSADVQPMAQARVRSLGAIAFIAKPVTPRGGTTHPQGVRVVCLSQSSTKTSATRCRRSPTSRWARPRRVSRGCSIRSSNCRCRA